MREQLAPTLSRTIWTTLSCHPCHTVGFHSHQDGLAMEKDFIQTQHQDPPLTELIKEG